ncbi:hypothetical protein [Streptomyces antibioticus]|uniref:hypothetical protein n=1 Tax=Streptomyces antibioticus TaxID=1890 RepID=UPI003799499E
MVPTRSGRLPFLVDAALKARERADERAAARARALAAIEQAREGVGAEHAYLADYLTEGLAHGVDPQHIEEAAGRLVAACAPTADSAAELARGPQTFQAVNNLLVDAGIGLDRLAGDDPKLKAANTALQYATEAVEERAAQESADRYIARDFPAVAALLAEPEVEAGHPLWCVPSECLAQRDDEGNLWTEHMAAAQHFIIGDGRPDPVHLTVQLAYTPQWDDEPTVYVAEDRGNATLLTADQVPAAQATAYALGDALGKAHAQMTGAPAGRPGDQALMAALNAIARAVAEADDTEATRRALQSYAARVAAK